MRFYITKGDNNVVLRGDSTFGLKKGVVRGFIALMAVFVYVFLLAYSYVADVSRPIPTEASAVATLIIGYYFGSRLTNGTNGNGDK